MDAKALAKSKRAHSLHHSKKTHSDRKLKAPSGGTNDSRSGEKPSVKQVKENARHLALPSNWDRYEEEIDLDSETASGDARQIVSDVSLPKSKGMNFRHLIAEAQSQCLSNSYPDSFPSLDDLFPGDFDHFGSMLLARGEAIVSWAGDDNFVVEDERAANHGASSLSLNLHALAEQLAKVDVSKRLFIEADLLPSDLGSKAPIRRETNHVEISESKASAIVCEEMAFKSSYEKNKIAFEETASVSVGSTPSVLSELTLSGQGSERLNRIEGDLNSHHDKKSSQQRTPESSTQFNANSIADPKNTQSKYEAGAVESELDILLESFTVHDSSGNKPGTSVIVSQKQTSPAPLQFTRDVPSSSKRTSMPMSLDDKLDDLLEETSSSSQSGLRQPWQVKALPHESHSPPSSSQSLGKSKILDDFDSWLDTI
uniref:Uncharacterized protein MANES_12G086300 n=1 Tax=Rhizophora mucronata TaxID=61149 RepID=A0A2P2NGK6_RHIMU